MLRRRNGPEGEEAYAPPLDFNHRVYQVVARIPAGKVTTYGAIATALAVPRKAREVGWALAAKPKDILAPAHRVINREGALSGGWAFGTPEVQRALLEAEGVTFLPDGRVDLAKHLWRPDGGTFQPDLEQLNRR